MFDVLLVCSERGVIEETNAALCELVGRTDTELRGTSFYDLLADAQSVARARLLTSSKRCARICASTTCWPICPR